MQQLITKPSQICFQRNQVKTGENFEIQLYQYSISKIDSNVHIS